MTKKASSVHDSDCALHNAPALPVGECDCSISAATEAENLRSRLAATGADQEAIDDAIAHPWAPEHPRPGIRRGMEQETETDWLELERLLRRKYVIRRNRGIDYIEAALGDLVKVITRHVENELEPGEPPF